MGALYRLGQRFVDFCKMTQTVTQDADSVPSNKAVYDYVRDNLNDAFSIAHITISGKSVSQGAFSLSFRIPIPQGYKAIAISSWNFSRYGNVFYDGLQFWDDNTAVSLEGYANSATTINGNINVLCTKL